MGAVCKLGYRVIDRFPRVRAEPAFDPIPKLPIARVVTPPGPEDHRSLHYGNSPRPPGERRDSMAADGCKFSIVEMAFAFDKPRYKYRAVEESLPLLSINVLVCDFLFLQR